MRCFTTSLSHRSFCKKHSCVLARYPNNLHYVCKIVYWIDAQQRCEQISVWLITYFSHGKTFGVVLKSNPADGTSNRFFQQLFSLNNLYDHVEKYTFRICMIRKDRWRDIPHMILKIRNPYARAQPWTLGRTESLTVGLNHTFALMKLLTIWSIAFT